MMRRYRMRQKLFSLRDQFRIQDAGGDDVYVVKGKLISLRDRLTFSSTEGEELLEIQQKLVSLKPQYRIYRDDRLYAVVKKRLLSLLKARFNIEVEDGPTLEAKGNFLDYEYKFLRGDAEVARVSKTWFALRDSYGVQVSDEVDDLLILACAVVIDMINHDSDGD
jgi:uncharacterized protein YxjI